MSLRTTCLTLAAAGCLVGAAAAQSPAPDTASTEARAEVTAATPSTTASTPVSLIPPPPPGKGQVVFFRPPRLLGAPLWFNVRENGVALGKLTNGTYIVKVLDPGPHTFTAATENHNVLRLEIDDGETYYIRGLMTPGVLVYEATMAPADEEAFDKAFHRLKLAAPPEPEPAKKGH